MKAVKTGVIGSGSISGIYLKNMMNKFSGLDVVACSAKHIENAEKRAAEYGIRAMSTDELLKNEDIELIVVLTPAPTHFDLIKQALLAGKHVYTEKTLATEVWQAQELLALAKDLGLRIGVAPETFLGSAVQTAKKALDDKRIGDITSFHIVANRDITYLASKYTFLRMPGGGICYDYGVYYLTALVSLLGPITRVYAQVGNHSCMRKNIAPDSAEFGQEYVYENESQVNAVLTTASGVTGTFALNGDSAMWDQAYFTLHGTGGILQLGDMNTFGGDIRYLPDDLKKEHWETLKSVSALSDNCRGIGSAQMARCIRMGGEHLASAEMACHVLDIIEQIIRSGESGQPCETVTTCEKPAAFSEWQSLLKSPVM